MSLDNFKIEERRLAENYIEKVSKQKSITEQEVAYWNYELFIKKMDNQDKELKGLVYKIHEESKLMY